MGYWQTAEEWGISPEEKKAIIEKLWKERFKENCPDCGVEPDTVHEHGCDVARCNTCGTQAIQCDEHDNMDTWTGLWPGIKRCYENGWIIYDTGFNQWCFDLNREAVEK